MPDLYVFSFHNPYTGQNLDVFAPDYELAIIELSNLPIYTSAFQYVGQRKLEPSDISEQEN